MSMTREEAIRFLGKYVGGMYYTPQCQKAHRMAIEALKGREERRWIPVTERLPEQGQEVIVYDGGVLKPKVFAYHFWNKNYDNWARVTHWMPLPEGPKEEIK